MAIVVPGLFATVALPAYAFAPGDDSTTKAAALKQLKASEAQDLAVADDVTVASAKRDAFSATSAASIARARLRVAYHAYNGPSVSQLLSNPPYPKFDLSRVVSVALKYTGVPYVYGGANPSGFDCSGFTMFVYAQFGVALPHSSARQGQIGLHITPSAARPGDIVVMDNGGHVGIYAGNGMMVDAPYPGKTVGLHKIYNPAHWFVRFGT